MTTVRISLEAFDNIGLGVYYVYGMCIFYLYKSYVSAGFPHTVSDEVEKPLDLNELVVKHPESTYFVRVDGDSMVDADIESGDILSVDRSIPPKTNDVVIAFLDGKVCVKRLLKKENRIYLQSENSRYEDIEVKEEDSFEIWGVVTYVIHKV